MLKDVYFHQNWWKVRHRIFQTYCKVTNSKHAIEIYLNTSIRDLNTSATWELRKIKILSLNASLSRNPKFLSWIFINNQSIHIQIDFKNASHQSNTQDILKLSHPVVDRIIFHLYMRYFYRFVATRFIFLFPLFVHTFCCSYQWYTWQMHVKYAHVSVGRKYVNMNNNKHPQHSN